ncbi:MAG: hypothetical protein QUV05_17160 [Phycisphaerae bacterium]|nr:hypothetical protein [Phycisphaerae bacterium]
MGVILSIATAVYLVARDHTLSQTLPLPLKVPLSQLDAERLSPCVLVEAKRFDPLLYVVDQPPLDDYVCWLMQDEQGRRISLFVTYSSASLENPMHVVHGSFAGRTRWVGRTEEGITIASRGRIISVPLRADEFEKHAKEVVKRWITVRTCYANGEFCRDVWGAGQAIRDSHERHVYFSQVDVSMESDSQTTLEEATESMKRFLQVVIPVLLEDHWPDWDARPIPPPSWFPWLPVKSRPLPVTQPSSEER